MGAIYDARISELVRELQAEIKTARSEQDVVIKTSIVLNKIINELGIKTEASHELYSLIGGRADSVYSHVIFEYKKPNHFKTQKGINEAIYGRNDKDHGLDRYLINFAAENSNSMNEFKYNLLKGIGVGFDGYKFIFVRYVLDAKQFNELNIDKNSRPEWLEDSLDVNLQITKVDDLYVGIKRLILYFRSTSKDLLSPNSLVKRFGARSVCAEKHLLNIYKSVRNIIINETNTRVQTLFSEWNRLFGIIYGEHDTDFTRVKQSIKATFNICENIDIDVKIFLFTLQTYYNMILKILVSNLFSSLVNPFADIEKDVLAFDEFKFKDYILNIVSGKAFESLNVKNFFEIHFFEWYLFAWNKEVEELIRDIFIEIDSLETATSIIKPEGIGDMVKDTYQDLVPKELRHLLGEYYTPKWIVQHALDKVGYVGELGKKLLDPTCGSGIFLTEAIKRKISNNTNLSNEELILDILDSVVGFDINPISAISAKTNYLLSLGDISELDLDKEIRIPIYLCDSVLTPTVHAKQRENKDLFEIYTSVGEFNVPQLAEDKIDEFFDLLNYGVTKELKDEEFKALLTNNEIHEHELTIELFNNMKKLHKRGKNGFWASLLKNSYAPIYSEKRFDFVVGNPPWVSWRSMSDTYRRKTLDIWLSYGIFEKSAYDKITTHDDFAMAVTYVAIDHYLKDGGKLAFVLSQSFFKSSKGGEGFRKFKITRDGLNIPFEVFRLDDMVSIKPFKGAANRTSVAFINKGISMKYPLGEYYLWHKTKSNISFSEHDELNFVLDNTKRIRLSAMPINDNSQSPWLTVDNSVMPHINDILGESNYRGRKGIEPLGAKGIYVLYEPKQLPGNKLKIKNNISRSRLQEAKDLGEREGIVEDKFIYPAVGGRNIDRWGINSLIYMIVPHDPDEERIYIGVPEAVMKVKYTRTYEWLEYFHDLLLETRNRSGKFYNPETQPFYKLDNVGPYTYKPYKVVWREQKAQMTACVVGKKHEGVLKNKIILTDSKLLSCHFDDENEAHYLCAMLNSSIVSYIIENYTIDTQRGIDILNNIKIPEYDYKNKRHQELCELSKAAHEDYNNSGRKIEAIEDQINRIVAEKIYGVDYGAIKEFLE